MKPRQEVNAGEVTRSSHHQKVAGSATASVPSTELPSPSAQLAMGVQPYLRQQGEKGHCLPVRALKALQGRRQPVDILTSLSSSCLLLPWPLVI